MASSSSSEIQSVTLPGEISPPQLSRFPFDDANQSFRRSPSPWHASELLTAAASVGDDDTLREAAEYILQDPGSVPAARGLASKYLGVQEEIQSSLIDCPGIGAARHLLFLHPNDAIGWVDLCYSLVIVGKFAAARRAMTCALQLAPNTRFVMRAAARFYLHIGDFERALSVLRSSPRTPHDPWLAAAEIASARHAQKPPAFLRQARALLTGDFSAYQLTELASALGTIEFYDKNKRSKSTAFRLLNRSLENPTLNSLAQATWFRLVMQTNTRRVSPWRWARSFEARAWESFYTGDIENLLKNCRQWFEDQPVAERAATIYAWATSSLTVGESGRAIPVLKRATAIHPESAALWNNLAFSLLLEGKPLEAKSPLRRGWRAKNCNEINRVCLTATQGMLYFRSGEPNRGRAEYQQAIESAAKNSVDPRIFMLAHLNLAREEAIVGSDQALDVLKKALDQARHHANRPDTSAMITSTLTQIANIQPTKGQPVLSSAVGYACALLHSRGPKAS